MRNHGNSASERARTSTGPKLQLVTSLLDPQFWRSDKSKNFLTIKHSPDY